MVQEQCIFAWHLEIRVLECSTEIGLDSRCPLFIFIILICFWRIVQL